MEFRETGLSHRSYVLLAVVACVLQVALVPQVSILGGRFNAMLALAGVISLSGNAHRAVYVGFCAGLFYDMTASVPVGLMTLIMTAGSFMLASISGTGTNGVSTASIRLLFAYVFAICLANGVGLLLLGSEGDFLIALAGHGLVSALLTTLLAVPFLSVATSGSQGHSGFSAKGRGGTRFKSSSSGKRLRGPH